MAKDDLVAATVRRWAVQPFALDSVHDCGGSVMTYVADALGHDLPTRPRWSNQMELSRLLIRHGGVAGLAVAVFSGAGLPLTLSPKRGDIGLWLLPDGLTVGIFAGDKVAFKGPEGLAMVGKTLLADHQIMVWALPCLK